MAIWAELKKIVNSDFSKPLNELIDGYLSKGMVKSVQRGVISVASGGNAGTATATLTTSVNTNKAIVIYSGHSSTLSYSASNQPLISLQLTSSNVVTATFDSYVGVNLKIPYQVIEFY